jgi:predicted acyl esterase
LKVPIRRPLASWTGPLLWARVPEAVTSTVSGTAWNLASPGTALLRASYREGGPERHLVREGEIVRLRFEGPLTANRFLPGHRLRMVLSGAFSPLFSVNPQTGQQEFESDGTRAGDIRIHHSAEQARGSSCRRFLPGRNEARVSS